MNGLQHQRIAALCAELRLTAVADVYLGTAQAAAGREASFSDFLEETLRGESEVRRTRAREMFARTAGFPVLTTLDGYDFGFATGAPRQQITELASMAFVERCENVVLLGPSGWARRTWRSRSAISRRSGAGRCGSPGRPPW